MNLFSMVAWASFIAIGFSGWGIAGNFSGANAAWVGSIIMIGGAIIVPLCSVKVFISQPAPSLVAFLILVAAAIVNAVAVHFYAGKLNFLKSVDVGITPGIFVATVSILMVVFGVVLDFLLNHKAISTSQMFGIGTAVLTIYLMSRGVPS